MVGCILDCAFLFIYTHAYFGQVAPVPLSRGFIFGDTREQAQEQKCHRALYICTLLHYLVESIFSVVFVCFCLCVFFHVASLLRSNYLPIQAYYLSHSPSKAVLKIHFCNNSRGVSMSVSCSKNTVWHSKDERKTYCDIKFQNWRSLCHI